MTLHDVLATGELLQRPARAPAPDVENRALLTLAEHLASEPQTLLQKLAESALEVCEADSSGISILDADEEGAQFRWVATGGLARRYLNGTMPRDASPCGLVLERNTTLLFRHPASYFSELRTLEPAPIEALLAPFHIGGRPVGTVWVVSQREDRRFDAEDARLLGSLSRFACLGYQVSQSLHLAQSASDAKSEFLAMFSHELRTPLTGVIGYSDLLLSELVGPANARQKELLSRVKANSWHLVGIIDEILTLSRAEAGREVIHSEECDVAAIARDVLRMMEPQIVERDVTLCLEPIDTDTRIHTDGGKVRQVLTNLISNAVKYTERGGVYVSIESTDEWLTVHVRDTGRGIAKADQKRIFEPFTRLHRPIEQPAGHDAGIGTGLGLAISRKLAQLLGGDIAVRSALDQGSTFSLMLPRRVEV